MYIYFSSITQYLYFSDYHRLQIHPNINGSRGIVLGMENRLTIYRYTYPPLSYPLDATFLIGLYFLHTSTRS